MIYSRHRPDKPVSKSLQSKQPDHHSEQSWSCRTNTVRTFSLMSSSEEKSARAWTPYLLNLTWPFRYWNRIRYCSRMCRLKLLSLSCKSISCRWRDEYAHEETCPEHKLFWFSEVWRVNSPSHLLKTWQSKRGPLQMLWGPPASS